MYFMMYASAPFGTDSRKLPPAVWQRPHGGRGDEAAARRLGDDLRLIEEDAAQPAVPAEDGGQHVAVRAADVDQRAERAIRIGFGDGVILGGREAGHRRHERLLLVGVALGYAKIGIPCTC